MCCLDALWKRFTLAVWITAVGLSAVAAAEESPFAVTQTKEGIAISEGEAKVLFYQRQPKSLDGKYTRANYVHPLYDLDGRVVTEDFPEDHLHHRGIFWAWYQLSVGDTVAGDPWACRDFLSHVTDVKVDRSARDSVVLRSKVLWKSPRWKDDAGNEKPIVEETTFIRVHRAEKDARKIDFKISLKALEKDVRIGGSKNAKGYGGFSTRIKLPEDIQFTGEKGRATPIRTPVDGGPWMDMTGSLTKRDEISGLAVLCHPSLPGFPQGWLLRNRRSMQNPAYPGREPVPVSQTKPLVLRYRLVLHRGGHDKANLEAWYKEYAASNSP